MQSSTQHLEKNSKSLSFRAPSPYFGSSGGIPSPPGALPDLKTRRTLASSSRVGTALRSSLIGCCLTIVSGRTSTVDGRLRSSSKCYVHQFKVSVLSVKVSEPSAIFTGVKNAGDWP